jgi:TP901 family phage tail tape measure protein
MARTSATISVGADTRQLEKDIQSALSRDFKFKGFNEKAFTQPLGRITGASNEFQKSLDASNARVIAFGASAGSIFAVEKAFVSLIKSTIDVEKSLTDINIILNTTTKGLEKFGADLFTVAKDTGQSFQSVAEAATELARQGLGVEETLKRTRDALILTRLSGLDTVSSVEALTATLNSFNQTALDSTTIINKLANVDAAFAVSSADLANAIQRVGSSAQDAGVGFDELLAIVTSVQQTTARGGAVIGNSLKTIFTRVARPEVLDQLQNLGLEVRNLDGSTRPAIDILKQLSSTFDTLSDAQRSQVAESVGGVFQINILKAALGDLGKEYSVYNNALNTSRGATDQAIKRNEALNETLSALTSRTLTNFTQLGAKIGAGAFQPAIEGTLKNVNNILEGLANQDSESVGAKIGAGILGGLSTFISGPGLLLITAVIGKLFLDLSKFAATSAKTLLGIGKQAADRAAIEGKISSILSQEPQLLSAIASKQISILDVENRILGILREQNALRQQATALSGSITSGLVGRGVTLKGGQITTRSDGFIPNFAMQEIYGALAGGYKPGNIKEMNIAGAGRVVYNSAETVKRIPGFSQPAIMPPQGSKAGKNYQKQFSNAHGFNPYANSGFIPNFELGRNEAVRLAAIKNELERIPGTQKFKYGVDSAGKALTVSEAQKDDILSRSPRGQKAALAAGIKPVDASNIASILLPFAGTKKILPGPYSPKGKSDRFAIKNVPVYGINKTKVDGDVSDDKARLGTNITNSIIDDVFNFIDTLKPLGKTVTKANLGLQFQRSGEKGAYGAVRGAVGSAFEVGIKTALGYTAEEAPKDFGDFDVRGGKNLGRLQKLFGFTTFLADFKSGLSEGNLQSFANKIYREEGALLGAGKFSTVKGKKAFDGFIPNLANDLNDAINREKKAGVNPNSIRVGRDNSLISNMNPSGLGVYNTRDEPRGLSQGISRYGSITEARRAGAAKGLIPNFALYSASQGESGPLILPASKEANAALADLAKKVYRGILTFDQANKELDKLTREFYLIDSTTEKVRNTLTRADASYKRLVVETDSLVAASTNLITGSKAVKQLEARAVSGGRGAELARGGLEAARERRANSASRLQGIGIGASIAVPIVSQIVQEFMPNNRYVKAGATLVGDTSSFAFAGALFGPLGVALGGLVGVTIGLTKAFKQLNDKSEELAKSSRESSNRVARFSEDVQAFLTSREKVAGIQSGAITAGPEDLAKLESQRSASFNRIFSSVSEGIQKELLAGLSGTEAQLQSAIQKANDEIASNNFVNQFIQTTNEQLKDGAKNLDITDTLRQLGSIKTKNGEYIADLISQQDSLLKSFDTLAVASEKYYGINDQVAKSIEQASIAADKAAMSIDEFAKNDLFGFNTTNARNVGEAPTGFGTTPYPYDPNNPPKNIYELNPEERQQRAYQIQQEQLRYEKDFQLSVQESGKGLKDFILQLGDSGKLQKDKALELADSIEKVLNSDKSLTEKSKALQDAFGNLRNTSREVDAAFKRQESAFLNLSNLAAQTQKLFSPDPVVRSQAADFIQKGDFGLLVEDFLNGPGQNLKQNEILRGTNLSALQGILTGTPDKRKRIALETKFGEAYKKAAQEIEETGNLTDRTLAELQIAIQQTSMEASMTTKNLVELGSSIGDAATRNEVLNIYTEKESQLKKELGDNIVKLNYASSAAATSLQAVAAFKEGTIFADEYKQLQNKAREDRIRSGQGNIGDAFSSFTDEMTYGAQDAFRDVNQTASDTARTIKSEFNNAFLSFANGTETASDAFTRMANNISDRIQQLALEFATNQIFGSLFGSTGIGGGIGDFLSGLSKSKGGMIKGYSSGGNVTGGSGNKDDVPAMLSGGEYVIRKNAVKKYGQEYLQMLNEGKVEKRFGGGFFGSLTAMVAPIVAQAAIVGQSAATNPTATIASAFGINTDKKKKNNYFKYGGRVQKFASGGEAQFFGENVYRYNDYSNPTGGSYVTDPRLSYMAVTDPNNPQNKINQEREQALYDYLNYVQGVRLENERALQENIELNKKIRDEYNQQQRAKSRGAYMSFGLGVLGAGTSQFSSMGGFKGIFGAGSTLGSQEVRRATAVNDVNLRSAYGSTTYKPIQPAPYSGGRLKLGKASGGYIQGFANGGSSGKDDIPALLMGGEFVIRKEAVNNYGKKFFDDLNSGRAKKFANGGIAGTITDENQNSSSSTNNVNITINVDGQSAPKMSMSQDNSNSNDNSEFASRKSKSEATLLANKIKEQVLNVINEQQRPGGLLSSSVYKKIN